MSPDFIRCQLDAYTTSSQYLQEGNFEQSLEHLLGFYHLAYSEQSALTDRVIEIYAHRGVSEYKETFQEIMREVVASFRKHQRQHPPKNSFGGICREIAANYEVFAAHKINTANSASGELQASLHYLRHSLAYYSLAISVGSVGQDKTAFLIAKRNIRQQLFAKRNVYQQLVAAELYFEAQELKNQGKYDLYAEKLSTALFGLICPQKEEWEEYSREYLGIYEHILACPPQQALENYLLKDLSEAAQDSANSSKVDLLQEHHILQVTLAVDPLIFLRRALEEGKEFRLQQRAAKCEKELADVEEDILTAQSARAELEGLQKMVYGCQEELKELLPDSYQRRRYLQLQEELRAVNVTRTMKLEQNQDCQEEMEELHHLAVKMDKIVSSQKKQKRLVSLYDEILAEQEKLETAEEQSAGLNDLLMQQIILKNEYYYNLQPRRAFERDAGKDQCRRLVAKERHYFANKLRQAFQAGEEENFTAAHKLLLNLATYSPQVKLYAISQLVSLAPRIAESSRKEDQQLHQRIEDIYIPQLQGESFKET